MKSPLQDIGRLFIFGFEGSALPVEWNDLSRRFGPFGIILFARNIEHDPLTILDIWTQARSMFGENPLICIDQEGGRVMRLGGRFFGLPSPYELAKAKSPSEVKCIAKTLAGNLRAIGIGWNLAPVADLFHPNSEVIKERAFHADPRVSARYVRAWVEGQKIAGVASCLKHFPGHGRALADTHHERSRLDVRTDELQQQEAIPFVAGVCAGAEAVMLAHIELEDEDAPSSLSQKVIGYLRNGIRFSGVAVADDLCMAAISKRFEIGEAAIKAIQAGCDAMIISEGINEQAQALERTAAARTTPLARDLSSRYARMHLFWKRFAVGQPSQNLKALPL